MRAICISVLVCGTILATSDPALKSFEDRLNAYVKLRKTATEKVPALEKKTTPAEIQRREQLLAEAIRKARPDAKAGDILTPDIKPVIERILRSTLAGSQGKKMRASIKEGNPRNERAPGEVEPVLTVNATYPKNAPLSTVPPSILLKMPKLPKDVEYRFVGRTLILRDREANMIVDYMKEAVPAL
jgi:hypothetical protein